MVSLVMFSSQHNCWYHLKQKRLSVSKCFYMLMDDLCRWLVWCCRHCLHHCVAAGFGITVLLLMSDETVRDCHLITAWFWCVACIHSVCGIAMIAVIHDVLRHDCWYLVTWCHYQCQLKQKRQSIWWLLIRFWCATYVDNWHGVAVIAGMTVSWNEDVNPVHICHLWQSPQVP